MSDDTPTPFIWEGKELETIRDLMDAMSEIVKSEDEAKAAKFMAEYRLVNEHADANVGYLSGYFDRDTMVKSLRLFATKHPILGGAEVAGTHAADKVLEMGARAAREGTPS